MTATKAKPKYSLEAITLRVKEMHRNHGLDIENNTILRFGAGVFGEMKFLLEELKKATGDGLDLKDDEDDGETGI